MDADSLLLSLELASGSGQGLSPDRRASLLTSLLLVKRDYRYSRVLFWGRILGLVADYYIAQGLDEDQLAPRKTLYSLNCMEWSLLPPATEEMITQTSVVKGRFMGDPSHEYEYTELQKMNEGDKVYEEEIVIRIKEETRLVSIIDQIDKAVAIIPRGALFKSPFGPTHVNRTFEGEFSDISPMGRRTSFLSIARHTCGSLCKTAHFLRKETAVTTSGERMCPVTWHWWLPQSLDPASFLPEGGRAFGHLSLRSFHGSGLPAFPHLSPQWSLLIAGSGPNLGGGNTIPSSPFSSVSS
nr:radial spoke head protein 9 homolog isoform X1 [Pipistrellus kuhlii]